MPDLKKQTPRLRAQMTSMFDVMRRLEWDLHNTIELTGRIPEEWHQIATATPRAAKGKVNLGPEADLVRFFKLMGEAYGPRINDDLRSDMHARLAGVIRGPRRWRIAGNGRRLTQARSHSSGWWRRLWAGRRRVILPESRGLKRENYLGKRNEAISNEDKQINSGADPARRFCKWRSKSGGMDASLIRQMKAIADENRRLQRMYADLSMQADLLKEALGKK